MTKAGSTEQLRVSQQVGTSLYLAGSLQIVLTVVFVKDLPIILSADVCSVENLC